jgi:hypothetical protein
MYSVRSLKGKPKVIPCCTSNGSGNEQIMSAPELLAVFAIYYYNTGISPRSRVSSFAKEKQTPGKAPMICPNSG